ncbi:hypothetical protein ACFXCZ_11740 [Streptomyces sp. NPDC059396]|uniref:hypothetical protein n=1 Tax=Streptomyces sp. NPDC059396 TaxID=3346819 RepID=UPI00368E2FB0
MAELPGLRGVLGSCTEQPPQLLGPPRQVRLLAQHQLKPFGECFGAAGPPVVRRRRGRVQPSRPRALACRVLRVAPRRVVLEQRVHDVPGRDLRTLEAGAQAFGITLAEDSVPAVARIQERREIP